MDEITAALKARELVQRINPDVIPVDIARCISAVPGCELRVKHDLPADQPGYSFPSNGKHYIVVNGNDLQERQRFTALHELGHIVLDLPSEHSGNSLSYAKRPPNEIYCDVFAAELLLPYRIFKPMACAAAIGFDAIDDLSDKFEASVTATGSRFAAASDQSCAFVLSENGRVRYASRSNALRDTGAWISPGTQFPLRSLSAMVRSGQNDVRTNEIAADMWFSDWKRGGVLLEEARHLQRLDQTLTLLWLDEDDVSEAPTFRDDDDEEEAGLKELDGILSFSKRKRRR